MRNKTLNNQKQNTSNEDVTGRERLVSNIIFSWGGYFVFFVAGFIMPRFIDHHVGQAALGIWDLSWSFVNYMSVAGLGVGASVSRYVAKYRAENNIEDLRKAVSSAFCIQLIIAVVIVMMTALLVVWIIPVYLSTSLGSDINDTLWVVALLGTSFAVEMAFDTSRGIMTGCHRWDMYNIINASARAISVAVMVVVLFRGGGLRSLATVHLAVTVIRDVIRTRFALRLCQDIKIRMSYIDWGQAKKMFLFGGKNVMVHLPQMLLMQTTNVVIAGMLGPSSLAVFARPAALVRHVDTFMNKFAFVLAPTASALQGQRKLDEIRNFLISATRYSMALSLPMILLLTVYGDNILRLWMGNEYANWPLVAIIASGSLIPISQSTVIRVLTGMNMHGRIAIINLFVSLFIFGVGLAIVFSMGVTIIGIAIIMVLPLLFVNGVIVPIYACHKLTIKLSNYFMQVFIEPITYVLPFALCITGSRLLFQMYGAIILIVGNATGVILLGVVYWRWLVPEVYKQKIVQRIAFRNRARE